MNIHEFQAKDLLSGYGIPSPRGKVAITPKEAEEITSALGAPKVAVKAQVHVGGRLGAGGVKVVDSAAAARSAAEGMLGKRLVTDQTGPQGRIMRRVYIEVGVRSVRDLMMALLVDRSSGQLTLIGTARGGEEIEELARQGSVKLEKLALGSGLEPRSEEIREFAARMGLDGTSRDAYCRIIDGLRRAFVDLDAALIEINPLIIDEAGNLHALDVKMVLDNNALFRHPQLAALRDDDEIDHLELEAQRRRLNYVSLDGNIGLAVNGAGLGLATLDLVYDAKGRPANFMDIRTTATSQDVAFGIGLLLDNPAVKVILVNVHGGGMQPCDTIADGVGMAMRKTGRSLPIVARLAGNNAEFAQSRFVNFGCTVFPCADMWSAATTAASIAAKGS
jgi:succinyl-CoA synthetase beta subunit